MHFMRQVRGAGGSFAFDVNQAASCFQIWRDGTRTGRKYPADTHPKFTVSGLSAECHHPLLDLNTKIVVGLPLSPKQTTMA